MRLARSITPTIIADRLSILLKAPELGSGQILLQCPTTNTADINFGTQEQQPGFISPGGAASLDREHLKDVYVRGNAANLLIVIQI